MEFYDRQREIAELKRIQGISFNIHSQMTVVTGRRRIGKTSLILRACPGEDSVYLFVSRNNEAVLSGIFAAKVREALGIFIPDGTTRIRDIFRFLMEEGRHRPFNLLIDEFQDFSYVNPALFSDIQELWDQYRQQTHVNLIVSGSVYSMMERLFRDAEEPLFGRSDAILKLRPFGTDVMKQILADHHPDYAPDDLLALYMYTGGVPKYIESFMDNGAFSRDAMLRHMIRKDSIFIDEGKRMLVEAFGKEYGTYFSVLGCIAAGINTQPVIETALGNKSAGGTLKRLIEDYDVVRRVRPVFSKEGTQTVRYEIADNFLRFWFKYVHKHRDLVESGNYPLLLQIIRDDYETCSGPVLERYFRTKLAERQAYRTIGGWWDPKGYVDAQGHRQQCEIDIVAIDAAGETAELYEVKRNPAKYRESLLREKAAHFVAKEKALRPYTLRLGKLSLEDM